MGFELKMGKKGFLKEGKDCFVDVARYDRWDWDFGRAKGGEGRVLETR